MTVAATSLPPLAGAPMLSQGMPFPGAYMAPPSWPMYMHSFLIPAQAAPPTTLSECELRQELEARELEVERRTQGLNLNTGKDAVETRSAAPSERSSQICPSPEQTPIKSKRAS